jgi:acyl carrier protein
MTQDEVLAGVAEVLGRIAKVDPVNVGVEKTFADLGIDSVMMVDVVVAAEDRFGVMLLDDDWSRFASVGDAVGYIQQQAATGPTGATQPAR